MAYFPIPDEDLTVNVERLSVEKNVPQSARRRLMAWGVMLLAFLVVASPASSQEWKGKGRLQGKVVDPDGEPMKGAQVSLHHREAGGPGPKSLTTDKKGRWSYLGLVSGPWVLTVQAEGFLISEGSVQVNEHGPPSKPLHIQLKRPSTAQLQNTAADLIESGNQRMQDGDYAAARQLYEQALPDTPEANRAAVLRGIAQSFALEGDRDAALEQLEKSLALDPDDANTLRLIIDILLEAGRDDEAQAYIARLPEGEALDAATRLNMGIDLYNQGNLDGALEHFQLAINDHPDEGIGYYYRGLIYLAKEDNGKALADLKKFLELSPDSEKAAEAQQFVEYLQGL